MIARRRIVSVVALALFALVPAAVRAQGDAFPNHAIRFIVPFPPAGVVDVVARMIGDKLSTKYGQPVIVENKAGAGGSIGTELVAKAPADGYTILFVGTGFTVLPSIVKGLPWSPADFRAVLGIGSVPNVVVVHPDVPAKSMAELIALAKSSPTPLSFGSPGVGSSPHLSGELLAQMAGIKLTHVPYKGQPDAVNDLLGGRLTMMPLSSALAIPLVKSGKLRALAVTSGKRTTANPELPTVAEAASLPGYEVQPFTGVFVPAKTPEPIVRKLAADMMEILAMPDVKARMAGVGMELSPQPHVEFDAVIAAEIARWAEVIRKAGIVAQ
jgi:tripartite-type tricarboxylate transporter receptor subunit TctC